jgi:hypothetical protein
MASFDSPIGKKQIKGAPMRDFSIPDETGHHPQQVRNVREERPPPFDPVALKEFQDQQYPAPPPVREISEIEQQILEAKRAKREGQERLSDGAKRRIEMLIGMTRLSKDVEIGGQPYRLQTLASQDLRDAVVSAAEYDGTVQLVFETRKQLLARSLVLVAGVEIKEFLNSDDLQDRLDFIEKLDHALLLRLYNEYTDLAQQAQNKYTLKTEAEVKEVIADLKK